MNADPRRSRLLTLLLLALLLAACTSSQVRRAEGIEADARIARGKTVLLLPPEVQLVELQASGLEEPRADWTDTATALIGSSLEQLLQARQVRLVPYVDPAEEPLRQRFRQLRLLYEAVGSSIVRYGLDPATRLPSKGRRFEWTLGPGVRALRDHYRADYALYTFVYDSYASGGRKGMMVLGLLLGANVGLGQRIGYTSLVDLNDGRVVWTGFLLSSTGDLRNAADALKATGQLLKGVPL